MMGWNLHSEKDKAALDAWLEWGKQVLKLRHWQIEYEIRDAVDVDRGTLAHVHVIGPMRKASITFCHASGDDSPRCALMTTVLHELVHVMLVDRAIRIGDVLCDGEIEALTEAITYAIANAADTEMDTARVNIYKAEHSTGDAT